jgi:hypothetical protein
MSLKRIAARRRVFAGVGGRPARERAQIGRELARARVALRRVLRETAAEDRLEPRRQLGMEAPRRRRFVAQDGRQRLGGARAPERRLAGQHLVERAAEGEEIGAGVERLPPHLLGRHVGRRPQEPAFLRGEDLEPASLRRSGLLLLDELGQPEVEDLDVPVRADHDVRGLEIAVDHVRPVRGGQPIRHLGRDLERRAQRQRPARDPLLERLPFHQLHRDEDGSLVLPDLVHRGHARVDHGRPRARLAQQAPAALLARDQLGRQHLERHRAVQPLVLGPVDDPHAARAEPLPDPVVGERASDQGIRSRVPVQGGHRFEGSQLLQLRPELGLGRELTGPVDASPLRHRLRQAQQRVLIACAQPSAPRAAPAPAPPASARPRRLAPPRAGWRCSRGRRPLP